MSLNSHSSKIVWGKVEPFSASFAVGSKLWEFTYKDDKRLSRQDELRDFYAQNSVLAWMKGAYSSMPNEIASFISQTYREEDGTEKEAVGFDHELYWRWCAKWVHGGCRTLTAEDKYFAAMAQTKVAEDTREDLHIPWPAFAVKIPHGLIIDEDGREYTLAMFGQYERTAKRNGQLVEKSAFYGIASTDGALIHAHQLDATLADLLIGPDPSKDASIVRTSEASLAETKSDARIRELVKRATVGLLYTMQHTNNWKHGGPLSKASSGHRLRDTPPAHRCIIIGRPLSLDVREATRQDAKCGTRSAPSVQTLVRGHIKRQVVGPGRNGRKVIWVEPYWRGPEDAPILSRPYKAHA